MSEKVQAYLEKRRAEEADDRSWATAKEMVKRQTIFVCLFL